MVFSIKLSSGFYFPAGYTRAVHLEYTLCIIPHQSFVVRVLFIWFTVRLLHCESAAICCNFQSVFALTSSVSMSYMFCSTFLHWHCILVSGTEREINHNVFLYPVYSVTPHLVFWWPPTSHGWHPIFALIVIVTFVILWNGPHATILVVWWWIVNHSIVRVFLL